VIEDSIPNAELVLRDRVKQFVEEELNPISLQVETSGEIPEVIVEKMRGLGLFGLSIPKEYGGLGFSTLGEILVYEELTKTNACFRSRIGTSNSIGSMGIFGDEGYMAKSQIEMFLRDVRLYRIFEGTSEIQRMLISRNLLRE